MPCFYGNNMGLDGAKQKQVANDIENFVANQFIVKARLGQNLFLVKNNYIL